MTIENIDVNSYPGSEKVYIDGTIHPVKVAMRRVNLTPTVKVTADGEKSIRENAPVYIYDTSGVYTDPNVTIDINNGLPRLREEWISKREDLVPLSPPSTDACVKPTKVLTPSDLHAAMPLAVLPKAGR